MRSRRGLRRGSWPASANAVSPVDLQPGRQPNPARPRPMSTDDTTVRLQRCLDRLLDGDAQAREELIACAAERLTSLAQKMFHRDGRLGRWEDSADIAQGAL